jgi:hypothetical protein
LAAQFEGGGLCDTLIHMPTPPGHVDEKFNVNLVQGFVFRLMRNHQSNMSVMRFFFLIRRVVLAPP